MRSTIRLGDSRLSSSWAVQLGFLACLVSGFVHAADPPAGPALPEIVPTDWVTDYDYVTSLQSYLKEKYDAARAQGKTAHAYFYSNADVHCRDTQKLLMKPIMQKPLDTSLVVMLDRDFFLAMHSGKSEEPFFLGNWTPLMLKIDSTGRLTGPVFYPDMYVFHPLMIQDTHDRRQARTKTHNRMHLERLLARALGRYLADPPEGN